MREEQRLLASFDEYASVISSSLNSAIREPHTFLAVLVLNREGLARLDFIQNLSFKFVELLSLPFVRSDDATVRQSIAWRYSSVKARLSILHARAGELLSVVKAKAPGLMRELKPAGAVGGGRG